MATIFEIEKEQGFLLTFPSIAPSTLYSISIFFTLVGILTPLPIFDVSDISDPITRLLGRLK